MSRTLRLSDGLCANVVEAGSGEPVLLIHGVGMCAGAWEPQTAALSADYRVLAVDMPGHGGSDPLPGAPLLPDYVDWAARVVDALDLGPVSVAGHSMGALIAAGLAAERPDLVRRAALLNGVYRRAPEAKAAVLARASEIGAGHGGIEAPLARWFGPEQSEIRDKVAGWLRNVSRSGYAAAYRAFAEGDEVYAARLGLIRCPLLVMTADEDANSTPEMTRAMAALAPLGRAVVVPGHRHMLNLTAPDIVTAELRRWLSTEETAP
ncbi:alpha/beta hydrolase [Defluviimonas sp. WL0002]|nr:alpha/beta hydrolase [Defluviimonas sp. WL0002]